VVLNYYSDRVVGFVFFIAVIVMLGMYFFPEGTLNIIGMASAGIKPATKIITAIISILKDVINAVLTVL